MTKTTIGFLVAMGVVGSGTYGVEGGVAQSYEYTVTQLWSASDEQESVPDFFLGMPGPIAVSPLGEVFVLDNFQQVILVFDSDGNPQRLFGRRGEGPGEFQRVSTMGFLADTLWVIDDALKRVTYFSGTGEVLKDRPFRPQAKPGFRVGRPIGLLAGGNLVVMAAPNFLPGDLVSRFEALRTNIYIADPGGLLITDLGIHRWGPGFSSALGGIVAFQPFADGVLLRVSPDGRSLVLLNRPAPSDPKEAAFRIRRFSTEGGQILDRTVRVDPIPLTQAAIDKEVAVFRELHDDIPERVKRELPSVIYRPAFFPPVSDIVVSATGSLWVGRPREAEALIPWENYDPAGNLVGTVSLPDDFEVRFIGSDREGGQYLLGFKTEDLGVKRLTKYSVGVSPVNRPGTSKE